jgi:hypothetical protein
MNAAECPDADAIRRFLRGESPDDEAEEVAWHLATCAGCGAAVPDCRSNAAPTHDWSQTPVVESAPPVGWPTTQLAADAHVPVGMLAPPRDPGEIGRLGDYRVLRVLGSGGMGVVLLAEDTRLNRRAALKVMGPAAAAVAQSRERFLREARATAAVKHDHVVTIYQVAEERGVPYLAMELLEGETLGERLHREPILPAAEVARIGREIAHGLDAAHRRGLLHRDIKPANVWLEGEAHRVKILDFGLARALGEDAHLTREGAIVGTPAFMAPEQGRGGPVDHRADLFSLGVVLYRAATGRMPFQGGDTVSTLLSVATDEPSTPREINPMIPAALSDLILRLLEKRANHRPESAAEVARALGALEVEASSAPTANPWTDINAPGAATKVDAPTVGTTRRELPPRPSRRVLVLGGVVLALIGAVTAYGLIPDRARNGTVIVELSDAEAEDRFRDGELDIFDADGRLLYALKSGETSKELPPGKYRVGLAGVDGLRLDPADFELEEGGTRTVRVTVEPKTPGRAVPAALTDEQRKALEWVLANGGAVDLDVGGTLQSITSAGRLPEGPVAVHTVSFSTKWLTEAALENLRPLPPIWHGLLLDQSGITDALLARLVIFPGVSTVTALSLRETPVTDTGLTYLWRVRLRHLDLRNCPGVTDAGLEQLAGCPPLAKVLLQQTKASPGGVRKLSAALPACTIESDHGTFGPAPLTAEERQALAWVQQVRGQTSVYRDGELSAVGPGDRLPEGPVRVYDIGLADLKGVNDSGIENLLAIRLSGGSFSGIGLHGTGITNAGLARLAASPGFSDLRAINLSNTAVTDEAVPHLKRFAALRYLGLERTGLTDAGVKELAGLRELVHLTLGSPLITDDGVSHLKHLKKLRRLTVAAPQVTDRCFEVVRELDELVFLSLNGSAVTDVGVARLRPGTKLGQLDVRNTRVTADGFERLTTLLPSCKVESDHGTFEPPPKQ